MSDAPSAADIGVNDLAYDLVAYDLGRNPATPTRGRFSFAEIFGRQARW
jgi:hypothetical protein